MTAITTMLPLAYLGIARVVEKVFIRYSYRLDSSGTPIIEDLKVIR